jgi:hypothetical protein
MADRRLTVNSGNWHLTALHVAVPAFGKRSLVTCSQHLHPPSAKQSRKVEGNSSGIRPIGQGINS